MTTTPRDARDASEPHPLRSTHHVTDIDCPRAKTWMTPCIARDGSSALADDDVCVGCGIHPLSAIDDLRSRPGYVMSRSIQIVNMDDAANALRDLVSDYVNSPASPVAQPTTPREAPCHETSE